MAFGLCTEEAEKCVDPLYCLHLNYQETQTYNIQLLLLFVTIGTDVIACLRKQHKQGLLWYMFEYASQARVQ